MSMAEYTPALLEDAVIVQPALLNSPNASPLGVDVGLFEIDVAVGVFVGVELGVAVGITVAVGLVEDVGEFVGTAVVKELFDNN